MTVIRSGACALVHPRTLVTTSQRPIPDSLQPGGANGPRPGRSGLQPGQWCDLRQPFTAQLLIWLQPGVFYR